MTSLLGPIAVAVLCILARGLARCAPKVSCALVLVIAIAVPLVFPGLPDPKPGQRIDSDWYSIDTAALENPAGAWPHLTSSELDGDVEVVSQAKVLAATAAQLSRDRETDRYLENNAALASQLHLRLLQGAKFHASRALQFCFGWTRADASAAVAMHEMLVFTEAQMGALLTKAGLGPQPFRGRSATVLDVGAGRGHVTDTLARSLGVPKASVTATEVSPRMRTQLRLRGYTSAAEIPPLTVYDVVAVLNVLDRTDHALGLLTSAIAAVASNGTLVIATPLPFCPMVDCSAVGSIAKPRRPAGARLHIAPVGLCKRFRGSSASAGAAAETFTGQHRAFGAAAAAFTAAVVRAGNTAGARLALAAWSRQPYLSSYTHYRTHDALDSALFLFRRVDGTALGGAAVAIPEDT